MHDNKSEDSQPKALTFEEALERKQDQAAHGHGTMSSGDIQAEQLESAAEINTEHAQESKQAHDSGEDHDHTTNVPR